MENKLQNQTRHALRAVLLDKKGDGFQMINEAIKKLVTYGLETGLVPAEEKIYTTNLILDVLKIEDSKSTSEYSSDGSS